MEADGQFVSTFVKKATNMKRIASAIVALGIAMTLWGNELNSTAKTVTVFRNGAQVERAQQVQLTKGEHVLHFVGLSPYIDAGSVQVSAKGNLTILSVNVNRNYLTEAQRNKNTEALIAQRDKVKAEIEQVKVKKEVVDDEIGFIKANQNVTSTHDAVSLATVRQTNDYYRERLLTLKNDKLKYNAELEVLQKKEKQLDKQIREGGQTGDKATGEVEVKVVAAGATTAKFDLSYYVANATWTPVYDARVSKVGENVELVMKAEVSQNTKEQWENVKLVLSSANPTQGGQAPTLSPWELREEHPVVYRTFRAAPMAKGRMMSNAMVTMDAAADMAVEEVAEEPLAAAGPEVRVNDATTAVEYEIKTLYTLPSGDKNTTVTIAQHSLPATYQYLAIPKLDKDAFLTAQVDDWEKLHLMNGNANLYFQNTYVGKTYLNAHAATDKLTLSLGRDKSIVVKRDVVEKMTEHKVFGSKKEESRGWKITVKNNKPVAIDIVVKDQLPLSREENVTVTAMQTDGAEVNDITGEVTWKANIQPSGSISKTLAYKVKYPSGKDIVVK